MSKCYVLSYITKFISIKKDGYPKISYDFIQKFDYSSSNYTLQRYLFKIFSIEELISI